MKRFKDIVVWYKSLDHKNKKELQHKNIQKKIFCFITFLVDRNQWNTYYSQNNYALVGREEGKVRVGTITITERDMWQEGVEEMTTEQLMIYQKFAQQSATYPMPETNSV